MRTVRDRPISWLPSALLALVASGLLVLAPFGHDLGHLYEHGQEHGHGQEYGHERDETRSHDLGRVLQASYAPGSRPHGSHGGSSHPGPVARPAEAHGQCQSWSVATERHQRHADAQFETAERARHQAHGVCPGPASSSITERSAPTSHVLASTASASAETVSATDSRRFDRPPSRGPPLATIVTAC